MCSLKANIKDRIIIALDFKNKAEVKGFLAAFEDFEQEYFPAFVKIGMELFYAEGPEIIKYLKSHNLKLFLDLKIHDIPNTAYGAIRSAVRHGVNIVNVHANGGLAMMKAAKQAIADESSLAKLIAVTCLTSIDNQILHDELKMMGDINDVVFNLAGLAKEAALDGVVCSPLEAFRIKQAFGADFITVCPGIRPGGAADDQKRISTPQEALKNGADYLVIGRAITGSESPAQTFKNICEYAYYN
jgi:orotidine-5'-phosphate decarboxylase